MSRETGADLSALEAVAAAAAMVPPAVSPGLSPEQAAAPTRLAAASEMDDHSPPRAPTSHLLEDGTVPPPSVAGLGSGGPGERASPGGRSRASSDADSGQQSDVLFTNFSQNPPHPPNPPPWKPGQKECPRCFEFQGNASRRCGSCQYDFYNLEGGGASGLAATPDAAAAAAAGGSGSGAGVGPRPGQGQGPGPGPGAGAGAGAGPGLAQPEGRGEESLRRGKWSQEETMYAETLIKYFDDGLIDLWVRQLETRRASLKASTRVVS